MSIRHKLLLTMIALSSVAIAVCSWLAYRNGRANLQQAVLRGLDGLRRSRANEIEEYFRDIRTHADSLSDDRMFIEGMRAFAAAYHKLGATRAGEATRQRVQQYYQDVYLAELQKLQALRRPASEYLPMTEACYKLQDRYIVQPAVKAASGQLLDSRTSDEYERVHSKYDPPIRKLTAQFAYDDLLLIDADDLEMIYSVAKRPDLGTSLKDGPYRDTALAGIVRKAASSSNRDALFFADYSGYEPARGAPAAFVATPVFEGPTRVGIFVLQLSAKEIDRLVSNNHGWRQDGLGQTGDLQIVGSEHLMRSTARNFIENPSRLPDVGHTISTDVAARIRAYGTTILEMHVPLEAVEKGLHGQEGTATELSLFKQPTFVSFMPLKLSGLNWMLLSRMDVAEALAPVKTFERAALLWSIIAGLITVTVALLITNHLLEPILALVTAAKRISGGDLSARVAVASKDELGVLSSAFNSMADNILLRNKIIETKNRENESLLLNVLPAPIAERLKNGETAIADHHANVSVLCADIVGFTTLSAGRQPTEILSLLNGLFKQFDATAAKYGIEKIKTIGDAYMAVSGVPEPVTDHCRRIACMALEMLNSTDTYTRQSKCPFQIRIGLNSGPVAAGVIGTSKFIYDLWGDTVNMASRMESTGIPGAIQVTKAIYEQLKSEYSFEARGVIEIKGKGLCETWLLHPAASHPQTLS